MAEKDRDLTLQARLQNEGDLIFSWMAEGARRSYARDHVLPEAMAVLSGTAEYRESQDLLGGFLEQEMTFGAGLMIRRSALTDALNEWLKAEQGMTYRWTTPNVTTELTQREDALRVSLQRVNGEFQWVGMNLRALVSTPAADFSNVRQLRSPAEDAPVNAAAAAQPALAATGTDTPVPLAGQTDDDSERSL